MTLHNAVVITGLLVTMSLGASKHDDIVGHVRGKETFKGLNWPANMSCNPLLESFFNSSLAFDWRINNGVMDMAKHHESPAYQKAFFAQFVKKTCRCAVSHVPADGAIAQNNAVTSMSLCHRPPQCEVMDQQEMRKTTLGFECLRQASQHCMPTVKSLEIDEETGTSEHDRCMHDAFKVCDLAARAQRVPQQDVQQ